ncbi:TPA: hypothetical protein DCP81_00150 [Candidatus Azambacteria bacterium]|nr:hypothetical protein [Candidatus Azambacteria bacterium]
MKNKIVIISTLAILIIAGFGGYYLYLSKKPAENLAVEITTETIPETKIPATTTVEEVDTSDWKVYRNEKYGFEVGYPREWFIFKEQEGLGTRTMSLFYVDFRTPDEQKVVTVGVHNNPLNLSLDEWMSETGYKQVVFKFAPAFEETIIDGQAGRKYWQVPLLGGKTDNYLVPFKNKIYLFRSISNTLEFDKIMNSFKFIR